MTGQSGGWAAEGPMASYRALEADGEIHPDADQVKLVEMFEALYQQLLAYPERSAKNLPLLS